MTTVQNIVDLYMWGIINWARGGENTHIWHACPGARRSLIVAAAFARWEALYAPVDAALFLKAALWIADNLDEILADEDDHG